MSDIEVTSLEVAQAISQHLGDGISREQVHQVLHALNAIQTGDPVGMVRRNPEDGHVAHRVLISGVGQWRVTGPGGENYIDMQPTLLDWDVIYTPEEGETKE